jgi:hypothetical protein
MQFFLLFVIFGHLKKIGILHTKKGNKTKPLGFIRNFSKKKKGNIRATSKKGGKLGAVESLWLPKDLTL